MSTNCTYEELRSNVPADALAFCNGVKSFLEQHSSHFSCSSFYSFSKTLGIKNTYKVTKVDLKCFGHIKKTFLALLKNFIFHSSSSVLQNYSIDCEQIRDRSNKNASGSPPWCRGGTLDL